ncbi:MAG: serine hydrolase domain-containing protein [Planctomycetota bacterium]|jgi:CubicO group peptidase (beta-lactamase class C family)
MRPLLWILLTALPVLAQDLPTAKPDEVGLKADLPSRIDAVAKAAIEKKQVAGSVTVVARNGKVVCFAAHGELAPGKAMRKDAIFRIYSMTKPVTTVAAMMLVEQGKLGLDDPVHKHLPALKDVKMFSGAEPERAMTVRDLMRHTSGLTYGFMGNTPVDQQYRKEQVLASPSLEAMIAKLGTMPLLYEPGARWNYSVSTDVLGRVVEVVSGSPLDVFLREKIFQPLGMADTGFYVPRTKAGRLGANYGRELKVVDAPETSRYLKKPGLLSGGGGLVSTARDFLVLCLALRSGGEYGGKRILKKETVAEMTRNQLDKELVPIRFGNFRWPGIGFGLGFFVRVEKSAGFPSAVGEYGWAGAASTTFWIAPEQDLIVVNMVQHMPMTMALDIQVKKAVYESLAPPSKK